MKKLFSVFVATAILFVAGISWAGNVDTYGIGARATALGGAYAANAEGPYAAYYNPAGLSQLESPVASAGIMAIDPDLEVKNYQVRNNNPQDNPQDLGPMDTSDESSNLYPPHLGFAMPINSNWSFGVSAYVPFGLHLEWESDATKNPMAYNCYESWYERKVVTPTASYSVNENLSFGFGVSLGRSSAGKEYKVFGVTNPGSGDPNYGEAANLQADMTDDFNYSANVGVMYRPHQEWSIGVTYRSQSDADFEGDLDVKDVAGGIQNALNNNDLTLKNQYDISMEDVDHPDQVQFGVRFQPYDAISMEFDLVWTRWSMVDEQTVELDSPDPAIKELLDDDKIVYKRDWEDTRQVRVGVEWQASDMVTMRGGYFYDPSPIPDSSFDAQWPDADKKTYSLGAGFELNENWTVDTVLQYTTVEHDRIVGGESENLNHSYHTDTNTAKVSTKADATLWGYGTTLNYRF